MIELKESDFNKKCDYSLDESFFSTNMKVCGIQNEKVSKKMQMHIIEEENDRIDNSDEFEFFTKEGPKKAFCKDEKNLNIEPKGEVFKKAVQQSKCKNRVTLQYMENELLNKVPIILHNESLFYYSGKTYLPIKNDIDLISLIRENVSIDGFDASSIKHFQDLLTFMKADKRLIPSNYEKKLKKSKFLVPLENGILDLRTYRMLEFSPKYLTFHKLNIKLKNAKPKVFIRFLNQSSGGNDEIKIRILEMLGYIFSGCNEAKCFFVLGIAPNSGKSTLANLLKEIIGNEFVSGISTYQMGNRFSLGDIQGKMLNLAMDIPHGKLNPTVVSVLKNITGKDTITIEQKYQRPETIVSNMRFVFGTNYPVRLPAEDDEDSFWNRMVVVPFMQTVSPDNVDINLIDKMIQEKDEIVSVCLYAYANVIKNNYQFSYCQAAEDMKMSWRKNDVSNYSFAVFWNECIEISGNEQDFIYTQDMYSLYNYHCLNRKLDPIGYNEMLNWIERNTDSELCRRKRIHKTGENPRSGICGIRLIDF